MIMKNWLELISDDCCLLKIDLESFIRVIVKRSKDVLTIQMAISEQQIAEILFPNIKNYLAISANPPQCEIIYHRFFNRKYQWAIKDGSVLRNTGSLHGTFVDGVRLLSYEVRELHHGNVVTFAEQPYPQIKYFESKEEVNFA